MAETDFRHEERHAGRRVLVLRRTFPGTGQDPFFVGYASVEPGHPWYNLSYLDPAVDVRVHGDLSFNGELRGESGRWFGFDCAHAGDSIHEEKVGEFGHHCTFGFALFHARKLAEQISDALFNEPIFPRRVFVCCGRQFDTRSEAEEYREQMLARFRDPEFRFKHRDRIAQVKLSAFDVIEKAVMPEFVVYDDSDEAKRDDEAQRDDEAVRDVLRRHLPGAYGYFAP